MDITYSFTDDSDTYVGHARYDGFIYGDTYYQASTAPVKTLADAQRALDALILAIAKRFPRWERDASEPRLIADDWRGNPVRVVISFASRGGES